MYLVVFADWCSLCPLHVTSCDAQGCLYELEQIRVHYLFSDEFGSLLDLRAPVTRLLCKLCSNDYWKSSTVSVYPDLNICISMRFLISFQDPFLCMAMRLLTIGVPFRFFAVLVKS